MMRAQDTPYIRIYNMQRERIYTFENEDVEATIQQMETLMPYISSYGRIIVEAATDKAKKANYASSFKWNCEFEKPAGAAIAGPVNPWGAIPPGYISNEVMMAKLEVLTQQMASNRTIDDLNRRLAEKDKEDPMGKIEKLAPALMFLAGKPLNEIQQFASLYKTGSVPGGIAGPPGNTLTFSDVKALPDAEKAAKCQALANELAGYISIEHMIILQSGLIAKLKADPAFINTILSFL